MGFAPLLNSCRTFSIGQASQTLDTAVCKFGVGQTYLEDRSHPLFRYKDRAYGGLCSISDIPDEGSRIDGFKYYRLFGFPSSLP